MTKAKETLLKTYAYLKAQAKALDAELEVAEGKVLAYLEKEGVDTLKEEYGTFSVVNRKKWIYSVALQEKEKEYKTIIKSKQNDEQQSGEANYEESKGLSFRAYTEDEK